MAFGAHKLDLYRLGVQHPQAEAAFLARVYAHYRRGAAPTRLKEDFGGTAALAAAWVAAGEDRRALAVESHAPTARWAQRRAAKALGARAGDLHVVCADVMAVTSPHVDIVAALNFSALIYHERDALRAYFKAARRSLRPGGLLVMDVYGGPGVWRTGRQVRRVIPGAQDIADCVPARRERIADVVERVPRWFDYVWEQRACDAATGRVDCRIHFRLRGGGKIDSAFRYDWRLWSLPELTEVMREAGFGRVEVWCDRLLPARRRAAARSDGVYRPVRNIEAREDWIAYVVGVR